MSVLKINEKDILWKYYKKSYLHSDCKEVPPPSNFCHYFWSGLLGMLLAFAYESNLMLVWLTVAASFVGSGFLCWHWLNTGNMLLHALMFPMALVSIMCLICMVPLTGDRLKGVWSKIYDRCLSIFVIAFIVCGVTIVIGMVSVAVLQESFGTLLAACWQGLLVFGLVFGFIAAIWAVILLLTHFILEPVSSWRLFLSCVEMLKSWKRSVCPLIEPPDTFMLEYEANRCRQKKS